MATDSPWSVKNVTPEAREAAKKAARKAGMTVGDWLNAVIQRAAGVDLKNGAIANEQPVSTDFGPKPVVEALKPSPLMQEAVLEKIKQLSVRVEKSEIKTSTAITSIAKSIKCLAAKVEEIQEQPRRHPGLDGIKIESAPMERTLTQISERLQELERMTTNSYQQQPGLREEKSSFRVFLKK